MVEKKKEPTDDDRVSDHLANERTYLAWIRTAVATMGMGLVISKSGFVVGSRHDNSTSFADEVGMMFTLVAITTIAVSLIFFLRTQREIRMNTYRARSSIAITFAVFVIALGAVIIWYTRQPTL